MKIKPKFLLSTKPRRSCLGIVLSGLFFYERPDAFDIRVSEGAGAVRGDALGQPHATAASTHALIGLVQNLLLLLLGQPREIDLAKVPVRKITGPRCPPCSKSGA